ncbi:MAG: hypothetical protein ACOYXC_10605, partial [Candidatus Rifleibacteriota bacterium]
MKHHKIAGLLLAFCALFISFARADFEAVKNYRFLPYSQTNLAWFAAQVKKEHGEARKSLQKKYADKPEKVAEHPVNLAYELLESSAAELLKKSGSTGSVNELSRQFSRLQRLHYSVRADLDPYSDPSMLVLGWKCGNNYLFGPLKLKAARPAKNRPVGLKQAQLEADKLCRPGNSEPVTREEIAGMNPDQISRLQPMPDHPGLRPVNPGNHFPAFVKEMAESIRATGGKKAAKFDFTWAKRIMFFEELKESASSPKISGKDRFGLKWKIKWGDEVHSDVVSTRLAIDLGATYTDLKFYSGPGETLLILEPKSSGKKPQNQAELAEMLLKSSFKFHLNRYVVEQPSVKAANGAFLGTGIVDQAMIERESLDEKYLGAYYLAFKECQLSIDNPALKRLGGIDLVRGSSLEDRVARSLLVFSTWISNPDVKEDNTRGGLLWNSKTGKFDRHVEFVSDMGASFAGPYSSGCLSTLSSTVVGEVFNVKHFKIHPVFLPDSWRHCTWADARWMARRIAGLGRADLERIFSQSG